MKKKKRVRGEKKTQRIKHDLYLTREKSKPAATRKFWMEDFEKKKQIQAEILRKDVKNETIFPYVNVGK